ncbi:MAG: ABC transporter permease [Proteobacteria bacterium]|nr:ABC transporter permease [Pseudomonadota bacterium]MDP2106412.1 ABC transporter permease [Desulfobulbaceae bacterium]
MTTNSTYPIFAIVWKSVSRKIFRNMILILAVALLVALLVFALLFNKAVKEDLEAAGKRLGADIIIVPSEAKGLAEEFILESKIKSFFMDMSIFDTIRDLPNVKKATFQIYLNTLASGCCSIDDGQVVVFDQDEDFVVKPWLEEGPGRLAPGQVYVGSYVYEYLGLINTASLFGQGVKVVGHLEPTNTGLDRGVFMNLSDLNKISSGAAGNYQQGKISIIFVKVRDGVPIDKVVDDIRNINPGVGIMTRGDIGSSVRNTLSDIVRVFSITITISSLLAILLAWTTFTVLANERRREVGILRAIGAHRGHIMQLFLGEAILISAIGGLVGVVAGHSLIHYLAGDFNLLSRLGTVATITPGNVVIVFTAMVAGVVVCLVGAAIPVVRLASMEPLSAIKEE